MEGQQRIGIVADLPRILLEMGQDPAKVIASAGIDPFVLRNPENSLTFVELGRLLQACVQATGCEHFGFLLGQRATTGSLGLVGRLMQNAATLKDAILDLCTNQKRYVRGAVAYLLVQNDTAFLGYSVHDPAAPSTEQISERAMAAAFNYLMELVGVPPDQILLARREPGDIAPYRRYFGYKPMFDAQQYAATFPAKLLARPVQGADRQLRRILEKSVAEYWAVAQPSLTQSITRILHARVVFPDATLEAVASELAIHPRTLSRRLQAEGTNFRDLVNDARFSVSRQLLLGTKMDVTDIAFALGYGDPSNFTHAFQKWSGMAPSEWRRQ